MQHIWLIHNPLKAAFIYNPFNVLNKQNSHTTLTLAHTQNKDKQISENQIKSLNIFDLFILFFGLIEIHTYLNYINITFNLKENPVNMGIKLLVSNLFSVFCSHTFVFKNF